MTVFQEMQAGAIPTRQTIRVHRRPVDGRYADVTEYEAHDAVTALSLPTVTIRLAQLD